jgi:hypothetical protein
LWNGKTIRLRILPCRLEAHNYFFRLPWTGPKRAHGNSSYMQAVMTHLVSIFRLKMRQCKTWNYREIALTFGGVFFFGSVLGQPAGPKPTTRIWPGFTCTKTAPIAFELGPSINPRMYTTRIFSPGLDKKALSWVTTRSSPDGHKYTL